MALVSRGEAKTACWLLVCRGGGGGGGGGSLGGGERAACGVVCSDLVYMSNFLALTGLDLHCIAAGDGGSVMGLWTVGRFSV